MITRRPWSDFANARSQSFVRGVVSEALTVIPDMLVNMASHKREERIAACGGTDPISITLAYAQDSLIYSESGTIIEVDGETYARTPRGQRVNVFGFAYRPDAQFWLHYALADIVVGASVHLYNAHGWRTVLYDGLRTVEGAYKLYHFATDDDLNAGLLALPGKSAHNKGMAVDSMMVDAQGHEIDMGGHFDHLDMSTNSRAYTGDAISAEAKQNRIIREAAFLRSAFAQGLLIAPLRSEFWDDRPPENHEDLWRVLDSAARCIGLSCARDESWDYAQFLREWKTLFSGHESALEAAIGCTLPPLVEKPECYHGNYHPIYDSDLQASGKHLTTPDAL
jgi:D-alanyl-D-alanine dipeptidase